MITILSDIGIAGGLLFLVSVTAMFALFALAAAADKRHVPLRPDPVFDAYGREDCPWCGDGTCANPDACTCKAPCARSYCKARTVARG
jgi:hypothetical protein